MMKSHCDFQNQSSVDIIAHLVRVRLTEQKHVTGTLIHEYDIAYFLIFINLACYLDIHIELCIL